MVLSSSSYVPLRDDTGLKSLSTVERDFVRTCALGKEQGRSRRVLRTDGRDWNQLRQQRLQLVRWDNGASATVQWGTGTRVTATCTAELIPPSPDRPSEGIVSLSVDLSPSASTAFRQAQPLATTSSSGPQGARSLPPDPEQKLTSNRILRCLERILLTGGALDTEALCVTPGQWVWRLQLSLTVLDAGGNLLDASTLACMAALRHYRKPHIEMNNSNTQEKSSSSSPPTLIPADMKEPVPLPLHHTPLSISFALLPEEDVMRSSTSSASVVVSLVDPNDREELVKTGTLTIAMNVHKEICLLDYGGGCELQPTKLQECHKLAESCIQQLCQSLETSLQQADEQALAERLQRLQQQEYPDVKLPPLPSEDLEGIPYYQSVDSATSDFMQIDENVKTDDVAAAKAQNEAEEAYRRQALDYNVGHVPSKVREDDSSTTANKQQKQTSNSLLVALLQSAQSASNEVEKDEAEVMRPSVNVLPLKHDAPEKPAEMDTAKRATKAKVMEKAAARTDYIDSDEEETTMELTSEFQSAPEPTRAAEGTANPLDVDDDDVNDLAAAIKKKKKKNKKTKKH